ncbi:MAG: T9SS type A sorting domain-containing protein [Flavobacteriales bacterium]|nr:T9SS type A sorting domain-containing protein [Flavobacteriales bacterium]
MMKNIYKTLIVLIFLGFTQTSFSQCNHTVRLTDTYGDGWNGGSVTVSINGVPVPALTNLTMATATAGPENFTFSASSGDVINITETNAGGWPTEMRVEVFDGSPNTIITMHDPVVSPGVNGTAACPVPNDDPCNAHVIAVGCGGAKLTGDNTGMTNSGISAPSCGAYAGGDVWYSITVPASGIVKVETYELTLNDVGMSIYSESGGCGGTLTEISCDDNSGFGNMTKTMLTGQTPGNTLYIRVWDNGNNQTGTFEIDVADMSTDYCVTGNSIDQGNGCAQLTPAANGQIGTIWDADDKFDFTADFIFDFIVNLGSNDAGADGITFVIQNDPAGLSAAGGAGGSMGSSGITNSLIVEIDTYLNSEDRSDGLPGVTCAAGSDWDHLDIWLNGDVNPGSCSAGTRYIPNAVELLSGGSLYNIENGLDHTLRITYTSASQTLTATVLNAAATVTYGTVSYSPVDPMVLFGTNAPYFGFTASTGGLNNQQTACLAPSLVLPIELANFNANCVDGRVKLDWATLSEINNDYFTIEKSTDAINFEEVTIISGAGNSSNVISYSWNDDNPLGGNTYYRLKQTDFNGEHSYSELVTTSCKTKGDLTLYPNPSTGIFSLEYFSEKDEEITIEIYNMAGQLVQQKTYYELPKGMSKTDVDLGEIDNGIYFVYFSTSNRKIVQKLTIVN